MKPAHWQVLDAAEIRCDAVACFRVRFLPAVDLQPPHLHLDVARFSVRIGGFELDLTNCRMPDDQATVTVFIAFGGGDIRVPRDWAVDVKAFAIFGGTDDKSEHPALDGDVPPKKLVIDGFVVFGGLDIKN